MLQTLGHALASSRFNTSESAILHRLQTALFRRDSDITAPPCAQAQPHLSAEKLRAGNRGLTGFSSQLFIIEVCQYHIVMFVYLLVSLRVTTRISNLILEQLASNPGSGVEE